MYLEQKKKQSFYLINTQWIGTKITPIKIHTNIHKMI